MSALQALEVSLDPIEARDFHTIGSDFSKLRSDFVDMSESDSSDDDDHSIESNDSDDTLVSPQVFIVSSDTPIDGDDGIESNQIEIAFREPPKRPQKSHLRQSSLGAQPVTTSMPIGKRLPTSLQGPLGRQDVFSQRRHVSNPCVSQTPAIPARKESLDTTGTNLRPRSSSLTFKHDLLRPQQTSVDEKMDVVGFTSYPRRKKPSALSTDVIKRFMRHVSFSCEIDSEETSSDESEEEAGDERKRASIRLFRTLGSAQSRGGSMDGDAGSPRRSRFKTGSIGKGSPSPQVAVNNSRSISCPSPSIPCSAQFGCVEVIVTPPTPRPADHSDFVKGVTLRPHGDLSTQVHAEFDGRLAAPFFDVAPGRVRMMEERQQALRAQWLASHQQLITAINLGPGSPVPPQANQTFAAAQFSSYTARSMQQRQEKGDQSMFRSYSVRGRLSSEEAGDGQDGGYDPSVPKYVAPGRRGYGNARPVCPVVPSRRHSVATTGTPAPIPVRHMSMRGRAETFSTPVSRPSHAQAFSMDSGLASREAVGRSMLARLERRRNSVDVIV